MDELNEKIEGLVKKAEKSGMPYGILKKVYDRGMAAWRTGHRPGTTPQQWAFARVNSFVTKSSGTWGGADKDLAKKVRGEEVEKRKTASEMIGQVRETNLQEVLDSENGGPQKIFFYDLGPQPFTDDQKKAAKLFVKIIKQKFNKLPNKLGVPYGRGTTSSDLPVPNLRRNMAAGSVDIRGSIESHIAFQKELKKQMPNIKLYYGTEGGRNPYSLMKFSDWDRRFPIKLTNYKIISKGPNANTGIDNIYEKLREINQLNEFEYIISFTGKDGLPAYYLDKIFKGSGPAHAAVRKLEKKTGSKRYGVMKYPPAKGKSDFDKKKRDFKKEDVSEKLGKDADAGDFVKDFRKSKAPQFKGKSDKKIQKMAIAAYLDSKEEKDLDEAVIAGKDYKYDGKGPIKISKKMYAKVQKDSKSMIKGKPHMMALNPKTQATELVPVKFEEVDIQESGHEDVASMKTQVQIAMDALQKMNMELGKLSDEDNLPTWWTNKVSTAVSKLDGMADYIDAKHNQGQRMNEDNITEEKVFVVRFEKEGMRFAMPFRNAARAADGKKVLQRTRGVSNITVTQDVLKPGVKLSAEGKVMKESKMGELFLNMQMDAQEMSERDFIKTYSRQGFQAAELKRLFKQFNEEVKHPMVKAAALATSVWAEKRHVDPADIDVKATAADRKAADKNIIIQLRRAQDMEKQTGRADQSGIEFLDKKKQKVDPKIINKALDMFDKMKPNDKQKMQQAIGKSYRDLLKTVQRGRV
jgi:hypothetical protein